MTPTSKWSTPGAPSARTEAEGSVADTTRKIEANIGRDLQFIRIDGTVVGSLPGLLIHTVSRALGA